MRSWLISLFMHRYLDKAPLVERDTRHDKPLGFPVGFKIPNHVSGQPNHHMPVLIDSFMNTHICVCVSTMSMSY